MWLVYSKENDIVSLFLPLFVQLLPRVPLFLELLRPGLIHLDYLISSILVGMPCSLNSTYSFWSLNISSAGIFVSACSSFSFFSFSRLKSRVFSSFSSFSSSYIY